MTYYGLSKSKIAAFEQCPKRLWLSVHKPSEAVYDTGTEAKFKAGHAAGELACDAYPDGIMIEAEPNLEAAIQRTAELLQLKPPRPLFEATFRHEGVLVRVDLMLPTGEGRWHVAEVKSSTSAKPYQLSDLATQLWVMAGCGIKVASASIRHLNNGFVYTVEGDYRNLFTDSWPSDEMAGLLAGRPQLVAGATGVLQNDEPDHPIGDHCYDPFSCPLVDYCHDDLTAPDWPISLLPNSGKKLARLWGEQGKVELAQLAELDLASELHRRVHRATVSGQAFHDVDGARSSLAAWSQPLAFLDFETIGFAIPRWIGTKPYQAVPFQFSLHVENPDGSLNHSEFLDCSGADPRRPCAEALLGLLPPEGAIIAYSASFEKSRIRELAAHFPDLSKSLLKIADRLVDLHPIAKAHYYHRDQRGSWSIKSVFPALNDDPDLDYGALDVGDGGAAQLAYEEAIGPECSAERKLELEQSLLTYCELDTWAMVVVKARLCELPVPQRPRLAV